MACRRKEFYGLFFAEREEHDEGAHRGVDEHAGVVGGQADEHWGLTEDGAEEQEEHTGTECVGDAAPGELRHGVYAIVDYGGEADEARQEVRHAAVCLEEIHLGVEFHHVEAPLQEEIHDARIGKDAADGCPDGIVYGLVA